MALGFSLLGLLTLVKGHNGEASVTGGAIGIVLGIAFLSTAWVYGRKYVSPKSRTDIRSSPFYA